MVDIKDLYPGCKVRIVDKWVPGCWEDPVGEMNPWLGQIMTVSKIYTDCARGVLFASMEEDEGSWYWYAPAIAEITTDKDKLEKPHICDILGVEVGEEFTIAGYPSNYGTVKVCEDGKIHRTILSLGVDKIGTKALYYLLNNPDRIIRKPRRSATEVKRATAIKDEAITEEAPRWEAMGLEVFFDILGLM